MDSDLSFAGDGELNVSSADGTATVDGELTLNVDGYRDFAEKARAEGLPVADSGLATGSLRLTDAGRLGGEYYAYTDADVPGYYKSLVLEALSRTGAAEETSSLVEEASLEEAAFSLNLEGGELKVRGYSRTTPLTRASRALLRELKPELEGTPEGAHVDYTFRPDGTGEGDLLIRFSDFMPNRSAAEIRKALGLPETAGVQMDASPDAVTLTRVERPEVQPSAQLAGVRSSARELAARGPAGEERGLPSWMLIAGGVAVVALLAVGWAVARQRASRV